MAKVITDIRDEYWDECSDGSRILSGDILDDIAEILGEAGYGTEVHEGEERVYVTRRLSGGRQSIGWVEIEQDTRINCGPLDRQQATLRDYIAERIG